MIIELCKIIFFKILSLANLSLSSAPPPPLLPFPSPVLCYDTSNCLDLFFPVVNNLVLSFFLKDRIVAADPITPQEKRQTLMRLNQIIEHRLVTNLLPPQMRRLRIGGLMRFWSQ